MRLGRRHVSLCRDALLRLVDVLAVFLASIRQWAPYAFVGKVVPALDFAYRLPVTESSLPSVPAVPGGEASLPKLIVHNHCTKLCSD
jgi:hypothetical protein